MIDQTTWASPFEFLTVYSTVGIVFGVSAYVLGYFTASGKIHAVWQWARPRAR